jgi:murein DD-endopeptidase MepM/ murein hydrolase activator NlpD
VKVAVTALVAVLLAVIPAVMSASSARAHYLRVPWPQPPAQVTRGFDAPAPDWQRGHRGVDLAGEPGQPVYVAGPGTVVYAGMLAGRPVVSVEHDGGLRTSYEPVQATVRAGQRVGATSALGRLVAGHPGCPAPACLHWGAMWGPAQHARYVDPLGLLADTPVRLKPWG